MAGDIPRDRALWHAGAVHVHHAIDYIELSVTDVAQAKKFYGEAFGWSFNDYGSGYAGICGPDRQVGGLVQVDSVTRGGPLVVLFSEALATTAAAVERAGGTITTPAFAFPGGRRFHFTDPSGNELAVWAKD
jgi:uncharacterized protein